MHAPNPTPRRVGLSNVSEDPLFSAVPGDVRGRTGAEQDGRLGWVLSWNIQPRGGMQTEEPKRKPYDVPRDGGSICLRALNALLETAEPN